MRDVVVVGAGHNALVAACYLARAGLDVEVVERDAVVGGAVSTVERWPGYRVDRGSSAHVLVRHTDLVDDLALDEVGLVYQDLDPWGFAPYDDRAVHFWVDLDRTCASIAAACGEQEADGYARFVADWQPRAEFVLDMFTRPPTAAQITRAFLRMPRGRHRPDLFLRSGEAVLDRYLRDERLKATLAWLAAQSGPPATGFTTAPLVGWAALLHRRAPGHPVGGSGRLAEALAARLASYGGRLRLGDGAARITSAGRRVTGVLTESGEHLPARAVLAGCHLLTTLDLLGDPALAHDAHRRLRVGNGIGLVVRLATRDLPRYPAATTDTYRSMQLLVRSRAQLRAAYADFTAGRPPNDPPVLAMAFSAFDDTLAPPGRHTVTLWGQWHPYALSTGEAWDAVGEREAARLVDVLDSYAPGAAAAVEQVHVQTPVDLEREMGLLRGNVMHLEMSLRSMFAWRPVREWSTYRGPYRGLYLCGASTHPGGAVFGVSGRLAAQALLADRVSAADSG